MLEIKDLTVHYDGAMALNRVSLKVEEGEFVGVVGPNGSGKTTLLRAISGVLMEIEPGKKERPSLSGSIMFDGKGIDKSKAWNITKMGVIHCPERRRPFAEMTTLDNLKMGAYLRKNRSEIKKDLRCLTAFRNIGYQHAVYLIYGDDDDKFQRIKSKAVALSKELGEEEINLKIIDLYLHPRNGQPAERRVWS